jgi:hypothetical protein
MGDGSGEGKTGGMFGLDALGPKVAGFDQKERATKLKCETKGGLFLKVGVNNLVCLGLLYC